MTSLYKKIPESATDSGIFYVKPYKSCRICLLRDHGIHRVRRIITGSYSPTKQRCAHVNVALQTADDFARRVQTRNGFLLRVQHLHVVVDMQTAEGRVVTDVHLKRVERAFLCAAAGVRPNTSAV